MKYLFLLICCFFSAILYSQDLALPQTQLTYLKWDLDGDFKLDSVELRNTDGAAHPYFYLHIYSSRKSEWQQIHLYYSDIQWLDTMCLGYQEHSSQAPILKGLSYCEDSKALSFFKNNRLYVIAFLKGAYRTLDITPDPQLSYKIDKDHWEKCEKGQNCDTILIKRDSINQHVELVLPCGGTFTDVYMNQGINTRILSWSGGVMDCPPKFNIQNQQDGVYEFYILACGLGGSVYVELQTERDKK